MADRRGWRVAGQLLGRVEDREVGERLGESNVEIRGVNAAGIDAVAGKTRGDEAEGVCRLNGEALSGGGKLGRNPARRQANGERRVARRILEIKQDALRLRLNDE